MKAHPNPADIPEEEQQFWVSSPCTECDTFGYGDVKKECPLWDKWGACTECHVYDCLGQQQPGTQREICSKCWGHGRLYQHMTPLEQLAGTAE